MTVGNIDPSWRGTPIDKLFHKATGLDFVVHNDADLAGLAEMSLGAGKGLGGTVLMITIGTGLGSGFFRNGELIPNIELGRMPGPDGEPIEFYSSGKVRKDEDLSWDKWGKRFNYFLQRVTRVCAPDHFIIGGGISSKLHKFSDNLDVTAEIHVAQFRNNAGIIGAAISASESL